MSSKNGSVSPYLLWPRRSYAQVLRDRTKREPSADPGDTPQSSDPQPSSSETKDKDDADHDDTRRSQDRSRDESAG